MKDARLVTDAQCLKEVNVGNCRFGSPEIVMIGGPCAVESAEQMRDAAHAVKLAGGKVLRGGVFKPRTSPYSFQGLGKAGLSYLVEAAREEDLLTVTEVLDQEGLDQVAESIDIIQIGARSMQNFQLLKLAGQTNKPVILKRGLAATVEEWIYAAEYILAAGNPSVIMCERGIRTYETSTRNTLDLSSVGVIKSITNLPVIVDPSHAAGRRDLVPSLAKAAIGAGADGLLIEMHPNPAQALCDGAQSLYPADFYSLGREISRVAQAVGRSYQVTGEQEGITELREQIDQVDQEIVGLLAKRIEVVRKIAQVKKPGEIKDYNREQIVIQRVMEYAESLGCPVDLIKAVYQVLFEQSVKVQLKIKRDSLNTGLNLVGE